MLATLKAADRHFHEIDEMDAMRYQPVKLINGATIAYVKRKYQISSSEILELNPDLSRRLVARGGWLPKGYTLKVPLGDETPNS
jgi:hypothetical protein